jgi:hypothetical protein
MGLEAASPKESILPRLPGRGKVIFKHRYFIFYEKLCKENSNREFYGASGL